MAERLLSIPLTPRFAEIEEANEIEKPGQTSSCVHAVQAFELALYTLPEPQGSMHSFSSTASTRGGKQISGTQSLSCCGAAVPAGCVR